MSYVVMNTPFSFVKDKNGTPISVSAINNLAAIWQNRVFLVLSTRLGERVMRPDFGSNLHKAVFESSITAAEIAKDSINSAFAKWLGELNLKEINPTFDKNTSNLIVTVTYGLPNGEVDSITINTGIFNRTGDLLLEIN